MASFDWTPEFCLACDRQTDGRVYCSEACRLVDYEKTPSVTSSGPSSPTLSSAPTYPWSLSRPVHTGLGLAPAYDLSRAAPRTNLDSADFSHGPTKTLSHSSSRTSLSSMKSNTTTGSEAPQLTDKEERELKAYANSFESARLQRRRAH